MSYLKASKMKKLTDSMRTRVESMKPDTSKKGYRDQKIDIIALYQYLNKKKVEQGRRMDEDERARYI